MIETEMYLLWRETQSRLDLGSTAIAATLGVSADLVAKLASIARRRRSHLAPSRPAPSRPLIFIAHVAGAAGDERRHQRCSRCLCILRLRRFPHVDHQWLEPGKVVFEVGSRLIPDGPTCGVVKPCQGLLS